MMNKNGSHVKPCSISDVLKYPLSVHAHEHDYKKIHQDNANEIKLTHSSRRIHDHDPELESMLLGQMAQIQSFINRDMEAYYALKNYDGLEKGVLVNACKGLGITKVKEVLMRVKNKPADRIRKSKGEYLTGALHAEVRSKGLEWGQWDV